MPQGSWSRDGRVRGEPAVHAYFEKDFTTKTACSIGWRLWGMQIGSGDRLWRIGPGSALLGAMGGDRSQRNSRCVPAVTAPLAADRLDARGRQGRGVGMG